MLGEDYLFLSALNGGSKFGLVCFFNLLARLSASVSELLYQSAALLYLQCS